ncbi:MAG: lipoprotein 17-related variable surface protein, partial [Pseudomonadota bacterium]|nr:lipoprotein 17-related variable surface protein [Pseudomonadota bacterium]
ITGMYDITVSLGTLAAGGYEFDFENGTLNVTPAPLTIAVDDESREYGDANPVFTLNYSGFKNGEDENDLASAPVAGTLANAFSIPDDYDITVTGGSDVRYVYNRVNGILTVTPAVLTITADDQTREYGDANPVFTLNYSGFKNGEDESDLASLATASTLADAFSIPDDYDITVTGGSDVRYTYNRVNGTLTVTPAVLTITADDETREYGDANPTFTLNYSGFKNGEDEGDLASAPVAGTLADAFSVPDDYDITVTGGSDVRYTYNRVNGTLTVTPAILTITADDETREYGDANPTFTLNYSGFKNGEDEGDLASLATTSTLADAFSIPDDYDISVTGGSDIRYIYSRVNGTLTVTPAVLTITADDETREYGDANPTFTLNYSGFKNGEDEGDLASASTASTLADAFSIPDDYDITVTGGSDVRYTYNRVNGILTVTPAVLTITADDKSREYGDSNPTFTLNYSGFKNGEDEGDLASASTASTLADAFSVPDDYDISVSGGSDVRYTYNRVNGTLSVTPAVLTITADDKTREYGDTNPAFTLSYSGFKNGEDEGDLASLVTVSTLADAFSIPDDYDLSVTGGSDVRYTYNRVNGTLAITPAPLTITADDASREYGDDNPHFAFTYLGFKNGDTEEDLAALPDIRSADPSSLPGLHSIALSDGADPRYTYILVDGTLTITPAPLFITADDYTRPYGDTNPVFTLSYTGFKNGERDTDLFSLPLASTTAIQHASPDIYTISVTGGSDPRYDYIRTDGTLAVTRRALTVTANDATVTAGQTPVLTVAYSNFAPATGFSGTETESSLDQLPSLVTTAPDLSTTGLFSIIPSGALSDNYTFVYISGLLTILPGAAVLPETTGPDITATARAALDGQVADQVLSDAQDTKPEASSAVLECPLQGTHTNCHSEQQNNQDM